MSYPWRWPVALHRWWPAPAGTGDARYWCDVSPQAYSGHWGSSQDWSGNRRKNAWTVKSNLSIYLKRFLDHQPPSVRVYSDITRREACDHNMGPGAGALPTNMLQQCYSQALLFWLLLFTYCCQMIWGADWGGRWSHQTQWQRHYPDDYMMNVWILIWRNCTW